MNTPTANYNNNIQYDKLHGLECNNNAIIIVVITIISSKIHVSLSIITIVNIFKK